MKIAICDDDSRNLEQVRQLVQNIWGKASLVRTFSDGQALLEAAERWDVCILDVVMPGMDGIQLGKQLRSEGYTGKIIYLTSSQEYAVDSYRVKAFDYLLKPVDPQALFGALDEICAQLGKQEKQLIVKTKDGSVRFSADHVQYVQLEKRAAVYCLRDGRRVQSMTLRTPFPEAVRELLEDRRFVLCSQSMAVNLQQLTMVEAEALIFREGESVYLGKKNCRELRPKWADFWFGGEAQG